MPTTISVTNAGFTRSPYNWAAITLSGSVDAIRAVNSGAFVDFSFTGTSISFNVDTSSWSSGYGMGIYYLLDGIAHTTIVSLGDTSLAIATGLSDTTHTIKLFLDYPAGSTDLWPGNLSLTITGVVLDAGKTITASVESTLPCVLEFGDSTMMGYTGASTIGYASFGVQLGAQIGYRVGNCGFSGQGWTTGGSGTSPGLVAGWQSVYNGQSRAFSPTPALVVNNMGENSTVVAATVTTWLGSVRGVLPTCPILQIQPFNQTPSNVATNVLQITQGYADYIAANPSENKMRIINGGAAWQAIIGNATYSGDGIHPNQAGCAYFATLAAQLAGLIAQLPGSPSPSPAMLF